MYTECITCNKLGTDCDGANLIALPAQELIKWCKLRKIHLKMSNAKLAELSKVPEGTINRIFAGEGTADFRYETARPIVQALLGGSFEGIPCPDPNPDEHAKETIAKLEAENARLQAMLDKSMEDYRDSMKAERTAEDFLMKQVKLKDKKILVLSILLALSLGTILIALIIDKLNPDMGFFWLSELLSHSTWNHPGAI